MGSGARPHRSVCDLRNSLRWRSEESGETLWPHTMHTGKPNFPRLLTFPEAPTLTRCRRTPRLRWVGCAPQRNALPPLCWPSSIPYTATPSWKRNSSSSEMWEACTRSVSQTAIVCRSCPVNDDPPVPLAALTACRSGETS